ncbi:accessory Sec system protein Asp2 [Candidatus Enterococcus ferrettii]|uniref:Accessory Sec system protein Asp2 n=1 Tax=Candidatus Enterococcus ferrettii TaxID=2815324 RepID=A0ABV0ET42_9ENTE|nr:accessory Sec system protein Asp2 [Enterococcus sp. 665A]MBO1342798.1 accessory Sec system protein Asp2 [Enterococcus sp. 665A]
MAKQTKLFHISQKQAVDLNDISPKYSYQWLPSDYDFLLDEQEEKLFVNGLFNKRYSRAIFVLEEKAVRNLDKNDLLRQLPPYQIIYDRKANLTSDMKQLLAIMEAKPLDMENFSQVINFVNDQFTFGQLGYKLSHDHLIIHEDFKGTIGKKGNSYVEVQGDFSSEFKQIISWKMTNVVKGEEVMEFFAETDVLSGEVELLFKLFLIKENTNQIVQIVEAPMSKLKRGEKVKFNSTADVYVNVALYAKGKSGEIRIGQIHIRRALADHSTMIPGGQRLCDEEQMDGEILYYFNCGDLKPPLAIYFSGYRSAEGFEGRRMMSSMGGGPFMLIADPRLEGGNFYLGSEAFEKKLVEVIQNKLTVLGFQNSDLILSGLSMGTFGALYYASDLSPNSVIIGKPLTNIGTIALNERVLRPGGFPTALDMLFYNTGEITEESAQKLNKRFWDKFSKGDYSDTTFAVAYMKQDDYDKEAFPMLFNTLKENRSTARVLYKGLTGRHNDNSPGVNKWFLKQYRNILFNNFRRVMDDFE